MHNCFLKDSVNVNFKVRVSFVTLSVSKINSNLGIQRFHSSIDLLFLKFLSLPDMEGISGNAITLWQEVQESLKTHLCLRMFSKPVFEAAQNSVI